MNGVESSTNAARMVRESPGYYDQSPVSGTNGATSGSADPIYQDALASAGTAVRDAPACSGSTDVTGSHQQDFEVYLTPGPVDAEIEDRKPGLLSALEAWVRSRALGDAQQTLPMQAIVPPEETIRLHP
jgi:hypothetical protein